MAVKENQTVNPPQKGRRKNATLHQNASGSSGCSRFTGYSGKISRKPIKKKNSSGYGSMKKEKINSPRISKKIQEAKKGKTRSL